MWNPELRGSRHLAIVSIIHIIMVIIIANINIHDVINYH